MLIDGFENDPLVAGEGLLALPGFWAAYLLWLCQTEENDPEPEWFGVDAADTDAAYEALTDNEQWPVIRIPFGGGHTVVIVGRNFPDDEGTEFFISHPEWDRHGHLATLDGHQAGPGLSWQELAHIAGTPDENAPGVHAPHARLLLLLPALGDANTPIEAVELVGDALVWTGISAGDAPAVAQALLHDHPLWEPAEWSPASASPLSGSRDHFPGILYCDDPGSPRCGVRLTMGLTRDQSDRMARALGTWPTT
ncbi:hypothetical protein OOK58_57990 [Streptomyces sp. NBC_01728]|uniref:hypothetical protein n=1 Tax=unclassified Streptomyces TaxID=2593676 RepID=UPI00225587A2|nr:MULTISPECIES: hypothetical protein [unclassified Streptomyces]MCX4462215.1 hypothetical protein [Streptomyces sp. NBC_01719]MCX4500653.1 hypothetical protein [Streptomyces sp. NBC_01728]